MKKFFLTCVCFSILLTACAGGNIPTSRATPTKLCVAHGAYPDPICTPGEVFQVSAATVCTPGYASHVRAVTSAEKKHVYMSYGIRFHLLGTYEIDHFIPLELGGDNSYTNLWPEPSKPLPGYHQKDMVEKYLHKKVCNGVLMLAMAQQEDTSDWVAVYNHMPASEKV